MIHPLSARATNKNTRATWADLSIASTTLRLQSSGACQSAPAHFATLLASEGPIANSLTRSAVTFASKMANTENRRRPRRTPSTLYRTVDREHPTLIIDEADDLFYRKSDLRAIVNAGWSRGTRIPRLGRWYDPFCPKILGILGKTKLPRTIASRSIILKMWPKKPDEKAEDFAYADDPEFSTIRRKLARWASDNVRIIKDLKPPHPPGFNNRLNANWKLLLQIAQHAGGSWPEQACRSATYLSRAPYEPSVGVQLLAALRATFTKNRTEITSEQVVQELLADPNSPWHEYRGRGPITKNQVAALLRDYDIRPVVVHPTKRADFSRHGYRAAQFEDAFARFLPHEPNIRTLKSGREGM